jgi:hypothetical protein
MLTCAHPRPVDRPPVMRPPVRTGLSRLSGLTAFVASRLGVG